MDLRQWIELSAGFTAAFTVGTLAEYVMHRLMHGGKILHKLHAKHHQRGEAQGWLGEFRDYFVPSIPILPLGFVYSLPCGFGFVIGGTVYAMLAAYAHQIQHEKPELVFWLRQPVHHLHHHHKMWHHNFGISVTIWDHIFRTYKKCEWTPEKRRRHYSIASYFRIKWF